MELSDSILSVLFVVLLVFVYFMPSIVAYERNHRNTTAIFVLNFFFGYTMVGWVAALIWAVIKTEPQNKGRKKS